MECDFSGYATKAGLKCADGRTIMPDAFKHQDRVQVPLVWSHGHKDPENVLGHSILENRPDGVYAYSFFNNSAKAAHAKEAVRNGDITMMSIWANDLVERSKRVLHGAIREVSLVLSGANPGALIDNVSIRHSDGEEYDLDEEAIIYTGLEFEHANTSNNEKEEEMEEGKTVKEIYDTFTEEQKEVVHYLIGAALEGEGGELKQSVDLDEDASIEDVYHSMNEQQQDVLHYLVGEALSNQDNDEDEKGSEMRHNVFESQDRGEKTPVISHSDMEGIMADAKRSGSLRDAVESYALAHGIDDIEILFPDAVALNKTPEFLSRRVEWVNKVLAPAQKSPFARIKTFNADITMDEARAKGYVKGALKKEEFFSVAKRSTTPTTIYKKQKLDRDDIIDITDFDIVAWLKAEMRIMLDEELARAILVGDGRDVSDEDKINEQNIRPIATDHELYATKLTVNMGDANSSVQEFIDILALNRHLYKGSGTPDLFVPETIVGKILTLKDSLGRRIYKNLDEFASEARVREVVPVEVLEGTGIVGVLVNMADYVIGANAGGQVAMFDDFDIDYNKQKYLIETRLSGALTRLKSAIVIRSTASSNVLATPIAPTFDPETGALDIPTVTGVVYKNGAGTTINAAGSPYTVAAGATYVVTATPASGYYFASSDGDEWSFTADE